MEKKIEAVLSIKMNERVGEGFNSEVCIAGKANDLLNCLEVGINHLHEGGIPKGLLHEIVDAACKDGNKDSARERAKSLGLLEDLLKDAPEEVREIAKFLHSIGAFGRGEAHGENKK